MSAFLALLALNSMQAGDSNTPRSQVLAKFKQFGYRVEAPRPGRHGLITLGDRLVAFETNNATPAGGDSVSVWLDAKLLLPENPDRPLLSKLSGSQDASKFKFHVQIDDVLRFSGWVWSNSGKDFEADMARFWKDYDAVRARFHATVLDPRSIHGGRFPPDSRPLDAICYDDLVLFEDRWKWKWKPHPLNEIQSAGLHLIGVSSLGVRSDPITVDGIELEIWLATDSPNPYLGLAGDVQVEAGGDPKLLAKRLTDSLPQVPAEKWEESLEQGKRLEFASVPFYGKSPNSPAYSLGVMFKLNDMSVGQFRDWVRTFADRIKMLPRK